MTDRQKKSSKIILVILVVLLFVWYTYSTESEKTDCNSREKKLCWTGCDTTFLPDRLPNDPPESSMMITNECGVDSWGCSPMAEMYPNDESPEGAANSCPIIDPPPPPPLEEWDSGFDTGFDTGDPAIPDINVGLGTYGCTDPLALNYDPNAGATDYSCIYNISTNDVSTFECCDPTSPNFVSSCYNEKCYFNNICSIYGRSNCSLQSRG